MNSVNEVNSKLVYPPLSEDEKEKLVLEHKNIVNMVANKYRFFDSEKDEIRGWGYLGLAMAISIYDQDREHNFLSLAYTKVKLEIINQYRKREHFRNEISLQTPLALNEDGSSKTLEEFLVNEEQLSFSEKEIRAFIEEALFEETELNRKINMDWLMTVKEIEDIAIEYGISKAQVKRTQRRGQALIKTYLISNDIILDYLMYPSEERKQQIKIINHREVTSEDYGKIKYIFRHFPFLKLNDIALILNTSSYAIQQIIDYPSSTYIGAYPDIAINEKVLNYCKKKYPDRLPGPVVVSQLENKIMA
jgi:DNA-directed RNA polymerase specialized sigma24 family protein